MPTATGFSGCDGEWGAPRYIGESEPYIYVQRCSGCGELMVTFKHRHMGFFTKDTTDREIVMEVLGYTAPSTSAVRCDSLSPAVTTANEGR